LAWLLQFLPAGQTFTHGLLIFVPGECLKIALAAATLRRMR
jgi:biotin transporter BioY